MHAPREAPPGRSGLDLGLDALLEDDGEQGAGAGLGPPRRLGQAALDASEFLTPEQRKRAGPTTPGPPDPAVFRLEGGALVPAPRRRRPLAIAAVAVALALAGAAALLR